MHEVVKPAEPKSMPDARLPPGEPAPDSQVVTSLQNGEVKAVESFVRANIAWMVRTAERILKDRALAEDCVQIAFVKIFASIDGFRGSGGLKGWIRKIVINEALGSLRKLNRLREQSIDDLLPTFDGYGCRVEDRWPLRDTPESLLASSQISGQVLAAINELPDIFRVVLLLRDIEEYSTSEVASMLDLEEGNVKVRLHRARAALKTLLEPVFAGEDL